MLDHTLNVDIYPIISKRNPTIYTVPFIYIFFLIYDKCNTVIYSIENKENKD